MIHGIEVIHIVHDCLFVSIQNETDNKPICSGSDFHFWQVHLAVFFRWHQLQTCMLSVNIQSVFSLNFCWQSVWFELKSLRYFPGFVLMSWLEGILTSAHASLTKEREDTFHVQYCQMTEYSLQLRLLILKGSSLSMEPKSINIDGHMVNCKKTHKTTKFHGGQIRDRNCKSLIEEVPVAIISSIGTWKVVQAMTIAKKAHWF